MKTQKLVLVKLMILALIVSSCKKDNVMEQGLDNPPEVQASYELKYTDQQLKNWEETGSPFLENELMNSSSTLIDENIPSHGGVFSPIIPIQTKAFGIHPSQNRFWSMVRLKLGIPDTSIDNMNLKDQVVMAIDEIQIQTNISFYNSINDPATDPIYNFDYPNIHIQRSSNDKMGSSFVGMKGGEQYIYLPSKAKKEFIMRALVNAAGMYNEQQRNDRDSYVNITIGNVALDNRHHFTKITNNFFGIGAFDFESITLAGSFEFSADTTIRSIYKKDNNNIDIKNELSELDRSFLNYFYLPFVARSDAYRELESVVFDSNNIQLTPQQRLDLQAYLNNGNPYPPASVPLIPQPW